MSQRIFPITMPKWGIEMQQGTITEWHCAVGQAIDKGGTLLEVETEKIVNSVEAPVAGTLRRILADKGATENVGALIALFADATVPDAELDAFISGFRPANTSFEPDGDTGTAVPTAQGSAPTESGGDGEARISPIARRIAERLGVDITLVKGTGRNGRVSKEDVEAYAASGGNSAPAPAQTPASASTPMSTAGTPQRAKMTSMRATIAKRLLESKQGIPHYRLAADVDLTALITKRATLNTPSSKVSVNDLLVRACALALIQHPTVNSQLQGDDVLSYAHADICIAVATDSGLVTPIVRVAETKTAAAIGSEIASLAERARSGKLSREDITGGTFTISNLGMFGIDRFDAIINPPQVAILAVGAGTDRAVVKNGQITIAKMATLTLSCDHRVVDGAVGAQFMATLKGLIESASTL